MMRRPWSSNPLSAFRSQADRGMPENRPSRWRLRHAPLPPSIGAIPPALPSCLKSKHKRGPAESAPTQDSLNLSRPVRNKANHRDNFSVPYFAGPLRKLAQPSRSARAELSASGDLYPQLLVLVQQFCYVGRSILLHRDRQWRSFASLRLALAGSELAAQAQRLLVFQPSSLIYFSRVLKRAPWRAPTSARSLRLRTIAAYSRCAASSSFLASKPRALARASSRLEAMRAGSRVRVPAAIACRSIQSSASIQTSAGADPCCPPKTRIRYRPP